MSKTRLLQALPAVHEVLNFEELNLPRQVSCQVQFVDWVRSSLDRLRAEILSNASDQWPADIHSDAELNLLFHRYLVAAIRQASEQDQNDSLHRVINATGILIHTNLGRAPLSQAAISRIQLATGYTNIEFDLHSGRRTRRAARLERLLCYLTGAEEALVVNNCAAATLLTLQAMAQDREVIISRSQLIEIGGGFRLPDVFRNAGVILREVGTTNRTYVRDYVEALGVNTGAIIRVHHSNFAQMGFVQSPDLRELVALKDKSDVPLVDDLGSGCMVDLRDYGLQEPTVPTSIRTGADVCLFSGDKLFGGPQAGIIVGSRRWISKMRDHPLMRALRADKLTLAALEATAELYLAGRAFDEIPVLKMVKRTEGEVSAAAQCLITQLSEAASVGASVVPCLAYLGGGSAPHQALNSYAVAFGIKAPELHRRLRLSQPAVVGRLERDQLLLDLRSVDALDLPVLAGLLNKLTSVDL